MTDFPSTPHGDPDADAARKRRDDPLLGPLDEQFAEDGADGKSRADVHGPSIAHHVFEPDSLDPSRTDIVSALVRDDAECREWAGQLRKLGELSDQALPGHDTRDLMPDIARRVAARRAGNTNLPKSAPSTPATSSTAAPATPAAAPTKDKPMGIRFLCPSCSKKYEVLEKFANRKMKCAKCEGVIVVPPSSTIDADGNPLTAVSASTAAAAAAEDRMDRTVAVEPVGQTVPVAQWEDDETKVGMTPIVPAAASTEDARPTPKPKREDPRPASSADRRAGTPDKSDRKRPQPSGRRAAAESDRSEKKGGSKGRRAGMPPWLRKQLPTVIGVTVLAILGIVGVILLGKMTDDSNAQNNAVAGAAANNKRPDVVVIGPDPLANSGVGISDQQLQPTEAPLTIDAGCFPEYGQVIEDVQVKLAASGGQPPYQWKEASGTKLPDGLRLVDGVVKGFVNEPGDYSFSLEVTDAAGNRAKLPVTWTVDPKFEIDVAAFPQNPVLGEEYQHQFRAIGGLGPYTYEEAGLHLPEGLEFVAADALLIGKPKIGVGQRFSVRLKATDSRGRSDEVRFRFEIDKPAEPEPQIVRRERPQIPMPEDPFKPVDPGDIARPPDLNPRPGPVDRGEPGEVVGWQSGGNKQNQQQLASLNARGCQLMNEGTQLRKSGDKAAADKKYDEAQKAFFSMLQIDGASTLALYNLACLMSLWERQFEAIDYLEEAIKYGYTDFGHMGRDPDLENIRGMPQFRVLMSDRDALMHKAAQGTLERLQAQFPGYLCKLDEENKFIFATNQSEDVLKMLTTRIVNYAKAQFRDILPSKPDYYIMIVLPTTQDFNRLRPAPNIGGWYNPGQRMLISGNIGFVLTHEFTHALHFADLDKRIKNMGAHKIWFLEGMATLFEDSKLPEYEQDKVIPVHNGRLGTVQAAVNANRSFPWAEYMTWEQPKFMENQNVSLSYSQARYITYWIWEQGKLKEFYETYSETYRQGRNGAAGILAIEKVFGRPLDELEAEWKEWVKGLKPPQAANNTYLGVSFERVPTSTGLAIKDVAAGSPAEKAGIEKGDIIVQCDGRPIDNVGNLNRAMADFEAGDVVRIMVIRTEKDPDSGEERQYPKMIAVRLTAKPGK